jgi:hypothetical protein
MYRTYLRGANLVEDNKCCRLDEPPHDHIPFCTDEEKTRTQG